MNSEPLNITGQRQLMVDPRVVAEFNRAMPCMAEASKLGRVISLDEHLKGRSSIHGASVVWHAPSRRVRLYYNLDSPEDRVSVGALALSTDGLHFEKPRLDLEEFEGSTDNNLIRVTKSVPDTDRMLEPYPTNGPVVLNGRLDEPDWRKAAATVSFLKTMAGELSDFGTTVRVLYDDEAVYVGFDCPGRREGDGRQPEGGLQASEHVEVFIDPPCTRRDHYYFVVNCHGQRADNRTMSHPHPMGEAWREAWQASVDRRDDGWTALIRIPLAVLELDPGRPGSAWGFNVGHLRPAKSVDVYAYYSNWASTNRHDQTDAFGALVFDDERFRVEHQPVWEDVNATVSTRPNLSSPCVFIDPGGPDEQRYKMTWRDHGYLFACTSADGLTFHTERAIVDNGNLDSLNVALWDPLRRKYVIYTRWWFREIPGMPNRRRGVARAESDQWIGDWPEREVVMDPRDFPGNERGYRDFYTPGVFVYENLYLAMPTVYYRNVGRGPLAPSLMVSTDGIHFEWVGDGMPLIQRSPGEWDQGMLYALVQPVVFEDRILIYYTGFPGFHHDEGGRDDRESGVGVASIRRDGFQCYWGRNRWPGHVVTVPIIFNEGSELVVNVETTCENGEMRVEVVGDERFTAEACEPIKGDHINAPVKWRGAGIDSLAGKPIRLKFHLDGARLHAFEVR